MKKITLDYSAHMQWLCKYSQLLNEIHGAEHSQLTPRKVLLPSNEKNINIIFQGVKNLAFDIGKKYQHLCFQIYLL